MLEELAISFVYKDEAELRSIGLLVLVLGFVAALALTRSRGELRRAPYFALSALSYLVTSSLIFVWLFTFDAMSLGILWVLVSFILLASLAIGYFYGVIARARALDAFARSSYALLAIIPLANLVLFLMPSTNEASPKRISTVRALTGRVGVLFGCVMFLASWALIPIYETQSEKQSERTNRDPARQAVAVEMMIRGQGLERTLRMMAAEVRVPKEISEMMTLFRLDANGGTLRYNYEIRHNVSVIAPEIRAKIVQSWCADVPMVPVLRAGGVIKEVHFRPDGSEIGTVVITRNDCGF